MFYQIFNEFVVVHGCNNKRPFNTIYTSSMIEYDFIV